MELPPSPTADNKRYYRYVSENHGGTYYFRPNGLNQEHCTFIGLSELIVCVGVYLPIDNHRCFVAHINAMVDPSVEDLADTRTLTPEEGAAVRNKVREKLDQSAKAHDWRSQDVLDCIARHGKRVVLACPGLLDKPGRPGPYVIEGINDFLGRPGLLSPMNCDQESRGFVVEHHSGKVWQFPKDGVDEDTHWERSDEWLEWEVVVSPQR